MENVLGLIESMQNYVRKLGYVASYAYRWSFTNPFRKFQARENRGVTLNVKEKNEIKLRYCIY